MIKRNPSLAIRKTTYIFQENSIVRFLWSMVCLIITRIIWFLGPMQFFYDDQTYDSEYRIYLFFKAIDVLLIFDSIIELNSSYKGNKGNEILDRNSILKRYSKWAVIDLLSIFPFEYCFQISDMSVTKISPRNINIIF